MNYKVLYRKYRPDGFENLVGQKHVVDILKNSIKEKKLAHAYLFSGPRGTGKTSTARILAKSVNCLDNKSGVACGKCESCLSFNSNPDIIEIDAASNNGVEEIRELINNVKIMPTSLKYKVYIIDEVHMLSQSAFNALLLTLEEPPEHVIFILATTNLESVPITIVSRCQRFEFHRITEADIFERLKFVCDEEKIAYEEDGLKEIANLADGGLRDALSILDQLSKNDEVITSKLVTDEIGSISNKKIDDLIKFIDKNDINGIEKIFDELQSVNLNYKVFVKKLVYALSNLGVKLLNSPDEWRLSFDDCKNIVLELNNILMKININVNPYLIIKMLLLGYVDGAQKVQKFEKNFDNTTSVEPSLKQEKTEVEISKKLENISTLKNDVKDEKKVVARINNCFVSASKNALLNLKEKWNSFIFEMEDPSLKGLLSDTSVVAASNEYAIIEVTIPHKDKELMEILEKIEELFNNYLNSKYKLVFIEDKRWNEEKGKYAKNIRSGYKYNFINENEDNKIQENLDVSDVADIFDIKKIEVE